VDILVVGAGPAGSATATLLARAGWRVRVVDRAAFPRHKPCSEYLSPEAVRLLDELGVVADLRDAGAVPVAGTSVVGPLGHRLTGVFREATPAPPSPEGLGVARAVLDATLVRAAREAGAEVWERTRVEALLTERGVVAGAQLRDQRGHVVEARARLVVGADGLRSLVARRLGVVRKGPLQRLALVAHVRGVPGMGATAEMHVGAGGYAGVNRIGEDRYNVALVVPRAAAREIAGRATEYFFSSLERFPGLRGRVRRDQLVREVLLTGPFASRASRVSADGALLVGDAADFFDPFTGQGITAALRGAELAAQVADEALRSPGSVSSAALAPYRRLRRQAFAGKWAVERLIGYGMLLPSLFDRAVGRLGLRPGMAHTLVGVTGDFVPATRVLNPRFLARMFL